LNFTSFDNYIASHQEKFINDLKTFLRQPSIAATGEGVLNMANLLQRRLEAIGAKVQQFPTGRAPVVYAELGSGPRTLMIYNHYDVQPADPIDLWTTPPFEPTVREGKLFARGVSDDKGDLMCRIQAIEAWQNTIGALPLKIKWVIEGEEEVGSEHLAEWAAEHAEMLTADGCLWEGGGKDEEERFVLSMGLKGIQYLELRVHGAERDLHSGYAAIAPSPVWRLVWALNSIKDEHDNILIDNYFEHVRQPNAAELAMLKAMPFDEERTKKVMGIQRFIEDEHGLEVVKRLLYGPTATVCGIYSGYTGEGMKTVLPNTAFAKMDFRLVPNLTPALCLSLLRAHLDRRGFTDVEIVPMSAEHPALSPVDAEIVEAARSAAREIYGHDPVMQPLVAGSGPMHPLSTGLGIPAVLAGIGYPDTRAHAPDENIRLSDYWEGMKFIGRLMDQFAKM
jgi:acetylornithine deacetylase/succinyl-diaminopimelate desuccinylase-like protein